MARGNPTIPSDKAQRAGAASPLCSDAVRVETRRKSKTEEAFLKSYRGWGSTEISNHVMATNWRRGISARAEENCERPGQTHHGMFDANLGWAGGRWENAEEEIRSVCPKPELWYLLLLLPCLIDGQSRISHPLRRKIEEELTGGFCHLHFFPLTHFYSSQVPFGLLF